MDLLFDFLKIVIPSGIVFATCYFLVKKFLDKDANKNLSEVKSANAQIITPLRLQAYERMTLFLERISPNNLIMRVYKNGTDSNSLHVELLKAIRSEYEHNLSQQIYISPSTWTMIKNAKEEIIKLINLSANKVGGAASGAQLSQFIIEASSKIKKLPTEAALNELKKEIAQIF